MRNDMTRVLVGCPRSGYNHKPSRSGDRLLLRNSDCELTTDLVTQRPLGHRSRESRVNRKPLERFLRKQVGRPWDQVYSEIAASAPSNTWLGDKLREEVSWLVDADVALRDGALVGRWGYAPSDLFVHPESGLLSLPESRPRRKYVHKKEYEMVDVDVCHKYVLIGALWYLVTLKDLPVCEPEVCHQLPREDRFDVVLQRFAFGNESGSKYGNVFRNLWGSDVLATSKRQASKKEIRWLSAQLAGSTAGGEGACSGKGRKSKDGGVSHRRGYHCGMRH